MRDLLVNGLNGLFSTFGFTCLPTGRVRGIGLTWLVQRLLREHAIEHVVDVGANVGQYVSWLRRYVRYTGAVTSFEPLDGAFAKLEAEAADDPKWATVHLALGDTSGPATINVMKSSTFSSLHAPTDAATTEYRDANSVAATQGTVVKRLDSLVEEIPALGRSFYLKIDTQGHDLSVVAGAAGVLRNVAACQLEIPNLRLYDGVPSLTQHLECMDDLGFELVGMFPGEAPVRR